MIVLDMIGHHRDDSSPVQGRVYWKIESFGKIIDNSAEIPDRLQSDLSWAEVKKYVKPFQEIQSDDPSCISA